MDESSLEEVVYDAILGEDGIKNKLESEDYKEGFNDCLKIICEIFDLRY